MTDPKQLLSDLEKIVVRPAGDRASSLQLVADTIRRSGNYRWVGLYDVDHDAGMVRNIVFSGPGAPAYPEFPITKGLTSAAVTGQRSVNVGDVTADSRYLTAFGTTRSEIIVPVFDHEKRRVIGTIDVESEAHNAFSPDVQSLLERCAVIVSVLWQI